MQVPCPYILSRFLRVTLCHTSKFRSIWYDLIYRGTPPETDRVYRNIVHSLDNYSNLSTVGFEPQTYCMAVWQPNHYTRSPDLYAITIINKIYNITNTCIKYIINIICNIYKINNKYVSKTICNRYITCNESHTVITS